MAEISTFISFSAISEEVEVAVASLPTGEEEVVVLPEEGEERPSRLSFVEEDITFLEEDVDTLSSLPLFEVW